MEPPCDVKALYDYKSEHDDDLNFDAGQVIHVSAVEDEEWLSGSYLDSQGSKLQGIFPKNFVELIEAPKAPARPVKATKVVPPQVHEDIVPIQQTRSITPEIAKQESIPEPASQTVTDETLVVSPAHGSNQMSTSETSAARDIVSDTRADIDHSQGANATAIETKPSLDETTSIGSQKTFETTEDVAPKPVKSNAFRDRIAAFNKQGAAPVAPKPMAKPNLAKKPFVAPPPSKEAFSASHTQAKPKVSTHTERTAETIEPTPVARTTATTEDSTPSEQPIVVGSLKDRIAALQAEQRQAAAKKAAAAATLEEPKMSELDTTPNVQDDSAVVNTQRAEDDSRPEIEEDENETARTPSNVVVPTIPAPATNVDAEMPQSPPLLARRDTHRSIESIVPQATGASIQSLQTAGGDRAPSLPTEPIQPQVPRLSENDNEQPIQSISHNESAQTVPVVSDETTKEVPNDEDEMDEEELRKQRLRERMAKMSGGMGIGMHMALGFGGPSSSRAPKGKTQAPSATVVPKGSAEENEDNARQAAPIPMPGLSLRPDPVEAVPSREETAPTTTEDLAIPPRPVAPPQSSTSREPAKEEDATQDVSNATARLSLDNAVPVDSALAAPSAISSSALPQRSGPPPIPGGRSTTVPMVPVTEPSDEVGPPPIGVGVGSPTMSPAQTLSRTPSHVSQAPARTSLEMTRGAPPPVPQSSRISIDSMRSPPPVPSTTAISRPSVDIPASPISSPILSPGGSKRISYFGASPTNYRPSVDSNPRQSIDQSRTSFDALSRTNSLGLSAPARPPPPPTVPAARAPPPPVPISSPPPPQSSFSPLPPSRAAPPRQPPAMTPPTHAPVEYPRSYETQPSQMDAIASENEREGYEADDDDTDVQSDGTQLAPEPVAAQTSVSTSAQNAEKAKKKGLKGLFKRKEK